MTAEKLHDAIGLLPADLVAEADAKRTRQPRVIQWKRFVPIAACLVLVLGVLTLPKVLLSPKKEAAITAEDFSAAPTFAARSETAKDEEIPAGDQGQSANQAPASGNTGGDAASRQESGHAHAPAAAPEMAEDTTNGFCGNTSAVLYVDGQAHTLGGSPAIALTKILINLDYDPEKLCRCPAEYTADTETETGYELNLTQSFARHGGGQASLTQEQVDTLRQIVEQLEDAPAQSQPSGAEPSDLEIRSGDASISASPSGFTWTVENPDGTASTLCACGAAPTEGFDRLPLLEAPEASASLSWDTPPESVTARCWAGSDSPAETAEVEKGVLTLKRSAYIYEVIAVWPQGTARYAFRASIARSGDPS